MVSPCPFCSIAGGEAPAHRVAERPLTLAFLDLHPVAPGHTLVVPRRHVTDVGSLTPAEAAELFAVASELAAAVRRDLAPAAMLHLADGAEAGQDVGHVHLHVIPRHAGDAVGVDLPQSPDPVDLAEVAIRLRQALPGPRVDDRGVS